jgi:hypothetical protein
VRPLKNEICLFEVFSRKNIVPADILAAQKIYCIFNRSRPMGHDFFDVVYLLGKSGVNFDYLTQKMSIRNKTELRDRLLLRCVQDSPRFTTGKGFRSEHPRWSDRDSGLP